MLETLNTSLLIQKICIKPYERRFTQPTQIGNEMRCQRKGWLMRLQDEQGRMGFGDIAPLPPQWGDAPYETIQKRLQDIFKAPLPLSIRDLLLYHQAFPSIQSGISMAGLTLSGFFKTLEPKPLSTAFLLKLNEGTKEAFLDAQEKGFRFFKIKINGQNSFELERKLDALWELLPNNSKLRLDANQSFEDSTFRRFMDYAKDKPIEFIEEPLAPSSLPKLIAYSQNSYLPIALDEQVSHFKRLKELTHQGWQGICIIKPAILGDYYHFIEEHTKIKNQLIYSSAFETAIGVNALIHLAYLEKTPQALGLGALHVIEKDSLSPQDEIAPCLHGDYRSHINLDSLWNAL